MTMNLDRSAAASAFRPLHHWRHSEGFEQPVVASTPSTAGDPYFGIYGEESSVVLYAGYTQSRLRVAIQRRGMWETLRHSEDWETGPASFTLTPVGDRTLEVTPAGRQSFTIDLEHELRGARLVQGVGDWTIEAAPERADVAESRLVTDLPMVRPLARTVCPDLVYDVGMHNGSDTDFYLKKGFRVVAVEANPLLAARNARRFADWIDIGRLVIVNMGISNVAGRMTFHVNDERTEWSSFNPQIASRGFATREITIMATPLETLFQTFGTPHYLKIDIEGMDAVAVEAACALSPPPFFISFENGNVRSFEKLVAAGYTRFKMVPQSSVKELKLPEPAREGLSVDHTFLYGSSGPFGEETPGEWVDADTMGAFLKDHFQARANLKEEDYEWWDMHAALPAPESTPASKTKSRSRRR